MDSNVGVPRRQLLRNGAVVSAGVAVGAPGTAAAAPPAAPPGENLIDVTLVVNGRPARLRLDPRVTLLDALRERLGLTGTKKGCDRGQCGSCTVHVDGRRVLACLTLAGSADRARITTIEGLADGDTLHPMQQAFIDCDALQCGFCTPGQIMSAVAVAEEGQARTDEQIREAMSGNICRCGAYGNIVEAVKRGGGS
jgi:xanthine dehydrogenase YagT iron-sulfur-binding subunit